MTQQQRLRVVHLITRLINGGADENTIINCGFQARAGHEVVLIVGREYRKTAIQKLDPSVRLIVVEDLVRPISPTKDLVALIKLTCLLKRIRPDVVHTHTSKAGVLGRLAAYVARVPAIVHGIHIVPFIGVSKLEGWIYRRIEALLDGMTDAYTSVSEEVSRIYKETGVISPEKDWVIESGMDLGSFRGQAPRSKEAADRTLEVIYVAALEDRKNHEFLLDVAALLREMCVGWVIRFYGEGSNEARLRNAIAKRGLQDIVKIEGYKESINELMQGADIGVFCSVREGLPRALVQYVAAGLPVVTTPLPGMTQLVVEGKNGFISPLSAHAFADRLRQLITDEVLRERLSRGSKEIDLSRWSDVRMASATMHLYDHLLDRRGNDTGFYAPETASRDSGLP